MDQDKKFLEDLRRRLRVRSVNPITDPPAVPDPTRSGSWYEVVDLRDDQEIDFRIAYKNPTMPSGWALEDNLGGVIDFNEARAHFALKLMIQPGGALSLVYGAREWLATEEGQQTLQEFHRVRSEDMNTPTPLQFLAWDVDFVDQEVYRAYDDAGLPVPRSRHPHD